MLSLSKRFNDANGTTGKTDTTGIVLITDVDIDTTDDKTLESKLGKTKSFFEENKIVPIKPTKKNILDEIKKSISDDSIISLFITYSGHGARGQFKEENTEELDKRDEYICTY